MAAEPKVLLDMDAAILFGDSEFSERGFFEVVPVVMTPTCLGELRDKRTDDEIGSSASDAYHYYEYRGELSETRVSTVPPPERRQLLRAVDDEIDLDDGERSMLRKLLGDDPENWFVASNDSDFIEAIDTVYEDVTLAARRIGTPAVAARPFVCATETTKQECLQFFETQSRREGWNWGEIADEYRADLGV